MELVRTSPSELTITGNIKTTSDYLEIRKAVTDLVGQGATAMKIDLVDSLSMPSSVIGFFVKLIHRDKVRVTMLIHDHRLVELLEELSLAELFGVVQR
jgi:hypothetical protein